MNMIAKQFHKTLAAEGLNKAVSDAIIDYVDGQKSDLVTNQTLDLEMTKLRGELKTEMADLRTEFATFRADMTQLVLGSSGILGLLMIALRFLPG